MANKSLWYPVVGGVVFLVLVIFFANYFGVHRYKSQVPKPADTTWMVQTKTVVDSALVHKLKAQIYALKNKKPVAIHDTLRLGEELYYAEADTTLKKDSSTINVRYYFPPLNYFDIDAKIHKKETFITKTIKEQLPCDRSFFDRFNWVIYAGIGYDPFGKIPNVSIGVGIGINIGGMFR